MTKEVLFHCGNVMTIPHLVATALAEHLLHGYDMAVAVGQPWPIDAHQAALGLFGYRPSYGARLNPATTTAHTAGYTIELITGERFTIRFLDGRYRLESPDSGPVDCTITADPVAFLLVDSGRMSQWAAIAVGLMKADGDMARGSDAFAGTPADLTSFQAWLQSNVAAIKASPPETRPSVDPRKAQDAAVAHLTEKHRLRFLAGRETTTLAYGSTGPRSRG